ncbi:MFS transporter, drug:H+ antiporter [Pseudohyphozyma bogoriensis]|nr:MFS transporter, drug:H+ antiporter [Pseudohyphozyma bogoriensis]
MSEAHAANSTAVPEVQTKRDEATAPPAYHVATQGGIHKVESVARVWGPKSKWCLWIGVALASYVYSLEGNTTYLYLAQATSFFGQHSLLAAVTTVQAITIAICKPVAAKISDVFGRAEAFAVTIALYVVGYIIIAACQNVNDYAAGAIIEYAGYGALQILLQILIADGQFNVSWFVTSLRWRGLVSSCVSIPFFINFAVAGKIGAQVIEHTGWRWGYVMFIFIMPASLALITATLFWGQHRAKKLGLVATEYVDKAGGPTAAAAKDTTPIVRRIVNHLIDMDAFGLLLFAAGWSCLLLPLTLVNRATLTWQSHQIIAMLTVGPIILIFFVFYEAKLAPTPLFPLRFFKNYSIVACALIGFFDFVSFYLQYTYQYSFIYVTKFEAWSLSDQNYFAYTQSLCLTFFAILAGFIQLGTRRTKWLLVIGLAIRLIGVGLMIKSKGANGSTGLLVMAQIIQGAGGGIASCSCQLISQAIVPHQDVATVTAFNLLFAEIGNGVGNAIAAAVWRSHMPANLDKELAGLLPEANITAIYGSITTATSYGSDSAIYQGVVAAYGETMKVLLIAATCIAVVPLLLSVSITDVYLSDAHNAVEHEDLGGRPMGGATDEEKQRHSEDN